MANGSRFGGRMALVVGLPLLAGILLVLETAPTSADPNGGLPSGLQPTEVNVSNDLTHRYGEPVVMANPQNPNNLVYFVLGPDLNRACELAGDPLCTVGPFGFPNGLLVQNGWQHDHVFFSFDKGQTWAPAQFPNGFTFPCCPPAPPPGPQPGQVLMGSSDPNIAVTADGTFYIGFDIQSSIANGQSAFAAGVGASKSTDGGRTWSPPVVVGTPIDRPWMVSDLSTGTVYEASGSPPNNGTLGPFSTGDPNSPAGAISDRWLVSSQDGVNWSAPQRLGGGGVPGFSIGGSSFMSAANGVLGVTFRATNSSACMFFVGTSAPCTVFQTTTDGGVTWTRHVLPVAPSTGTLWVAADPNQAGHFTVAVLNSTSRQFLVYQTLDSGTTWSGPTTVAEDATKTHFKPWVNYSTQGVLGLMWRTNEGAGAYTVWAATSGDGGATFSAPLQISSAPSPTPPAGAAQSFDDDSFISLTEDRAFIAWADWRPGERSAFFSAVKLDAFTTGAR